MLQRVRLALLTGGLGLALVVHAGPALAAQADPSPLACREAAAPTDEPVVVAPGEPFAVILSAQPGTGFSWSVTNGPDPAVATFDDTTILPIGMVLPGSTQLSCFLFAATGPGQTSIDFAYARPFEPETEPAQTLAVSVTVSEPADTAAACP